MQCQEYIMHKVFTEKERERDGYTDSWATQLGWPSFAFAFRRVGLD